MKGTPGTNRPTWQAATTHPDLASKLETALKEIVDPEIGFNIIQLGLVRDVTIADDHVIVRMILTTPFCPYGPSMLEATRLKAETSLERPAKIYFGMDAWDFSMMEEGLMDDWGLY